MANANIGQIALSNTFNDQRIAINNLANSVNELRNGNPFYKDNGGFTLANGVLSIIATSGTTLSVTANALIGGLATMTTSITTGGAVFFDNVTLTGANSWLSGANVITSPTIVANAQQTVNGYFLVTGLNTNAPQIATISGNAIVNIANVVLISNIGNMEIKGTVKFSNASATVNVANVLNVVGNTIFGTNANIAGTLNVVGGLFGTTANLSSLNVTGNIANTGNISVTQNIAAGNISITANISGSNLTLTQNSSVGNISVTQNVSAGNLSVTQNASVGNLSVTTTANAVNMNVSGRLTVVGASNAEIDTLFLDVTHAYSIVNGNAVFNNLTVQGTQTVVGNTVSSTDTLILRSSLATSGNGQLIIEQGTTNGNAVLLYLQASNVWQATANAGNGFSTLLQVSNIADSVSNTSITNVGSANAVKWAYNTAQTAFNQANAALILANTAEAYGLTAVISIYPLANTTATTANSAYGQANNAYGQANLAYTAANAAANTTATFANGTLVLSDATHNFNNTATVNVSATANGTGQVNIAFSANGTSLGIPAANANALAAYAAANSAANTVAVFANGTLTLAAANVNFNNTGTINVSSTANGTGQVNVAFSVNTTAVAGGVTASAAANLVAILANGTLTMPNANINFNNSATVNVSTAANTLGTFCNVSFSVNSAAVGGAYQTDVYANGNLIASNAWVNFNNTATVNVSVTSNGAGADIAFTANGASATLSNKVNAVADIANSALAFGTFAQTITYPTAVNALTIAQGALQRGGGPVNGNLTFGNNSTTVLVNPTLAGFKELVSNTGTINSPNTYIANGQITNVFDITTGNTQFNSINVAFNTLATANQVQTFTILIRQPGNSLNVANLVTFTNTVFWSNAEVPVLTNLSGYLDILTFMTIDGGQTFYGAHSMANVA